MSRNGDGSSPDERSLEAGFSLIALTASITLMLIGMAVAVPAWQYVMKNDREEELIFRGGQIADAVVRYQKKNGNGLPASFEVLVKGKYLRKAYKDPMTKEGEWRLIHPGEGLLVGQLPTASGSPPPSTLRPAQTSPTGRTIGVFRGVASKSKDASLRLFNGRSRYDEWLFLAGQPRVVGLTPVSVVPQAGPQRAQPGTTSQPARPGLTR